MTEYEYVSELVSRTGSSFEEARFVYESCGKDFAEAERILTERKNKEINEFKQTVKETAEKAAHKTGNILTKMASNQLTISASRELISLPILAAAIIGLLTWEVAVPAVLISFFCGVRYTLSGPDFEKDMCFEFKRSKTSAPVPVQPAVYEEPVKYTYPKNEEVKDKGFFN